MGCDIHAVVEIRQNGVWLRALEAMDAEVLGRNYPAFGHLASVRHATDAFPKGVPPDASMAFTVEVEDTFKPFIEQFPLDSYHSHSWHTFGELEQLMQKQLVPDEDGFYDTWRYSVNAYLANWLRDMFWISECYEVEDLQNDVRVLYCFDS